MPPQTKILQYTLFDLPAKREDLPAFMAVCFKFVEENEKKFKGIADPLSLFHNHTHKYSGIQFGIDKGVLSVRAYGKQEIDALKIWWKLYRKKNGLEPAKMLMQKEFYSLDFLPAMQSYRLSDFILSRSKQKELTAIQNQREQEECLANYLVANFFPFFNHLGYRHERKQREIVVSIANFEQGDKAYTVFRGAKRRAYNIDFECNLRLPNLFRMGQATAMGYGNVEWKK